MTKPHRVAAAAAAAFIAYAAWLLGDWTQGSVGTVISNIWLAAVSITATVFAARAARSLIGRTRAAWFALTVGLSGWVVGQFIWSYYEIVVKQDPFPSLADAGYLLLPIGACVALMLFPDDYSNFSLGRVLLDGVIVAGSLFLVSWVTVLSRVYEASAPDDRLGLAVSMAYPVSDLIVLTVAAMVLIRAETHQRLTLTLLSIGIVSIALADSIFVLLQSSGNYSTGNETDLGWVAGFLLLTVAAAVGRSDEASAGSPDRLPGWASVWLPYAPLLLAALVAASKPRGAVNSPPVWFVGFLLVVAVLGRQLLAMNENRRLLARVAEQARRDPLTGLANRTVVHERLDHAMRLRERDAISVGVVSLDLNDFKLVNDMYGHQAGDELLTVVAERLLDCVRATDTVARLGGDEFVVLIEDSAAQAQVAANRILSAFDEPFVIDGHEIAMLPSVGLAVSEAGEAEVSVDELLRRADVAMYASKMSRTREVQTFTAQTSLTGDSRPTGRTPLRSAPQLEMLSELRKAIHRSELTLRYQPQINLATSQIVGVEALVRWAHPERGLLGAAEFLPLVRRYGLMESVNHYVLNRALDDAREWHAASFDVPVAVNIFAPTLANPELADTILNALADRGLGGRDLIVEITEHLLLRDVERTRTVLRTLRRSGIRVALDDFGKGHSAVSLLRDLPVDQVKLDYDLIAPILVDQRGAALVSAMVDFVHTMGMTAVAEGVESAEAAARLRQFGCDEAQGHFHCVPVTLEELLARFRTTALAPPAPAV